MFPVVIYRTPPDWKHFNTGDGVTIIGWGKRRLLIAWWMMNPFRCKEE